MSDMKLAKIPKTQLYKISLKNMKMPSLISRNKVSMWMAYLMLK